MKAVPLQAPPNHTSKVDALLQLCWDHCFPGVKQTEIRIKSNGPSPVIQRLDATAIRIRNNRGIMKRDEVLEALISSKSVRSKQP